MRNKAISFFGYNDGKAIGIYNCISLFIPTVVSVVISLFFTILSFVLHNFYLLVFWTLPAVFFLFYILFILFTGLDDEVFLRGAKKKHSFVIDGETLIRDGKPIKKYGIKVYTFKSFVFLSTKRSYYRIPNEAFVGISREDFLLFMKSAKPPSDEGGGTAQP